MDGLGLTKPSPTKVGWGSPAHVFQWQPTESLPVRPSLDLLGRNHKCDRVPACVGRRLSPSQGPHSFRAAPRTQQQTRLVLPPAPPSPIQRQCLMVGTRVRCTGLVGVWVRVPPPAPEEAIPQHPGGGVRIDPRGWAGSGGHNEHL